MKIITPQKKKQNKRTELDFLLHYAKIISTIVLFFFTSIIANAQCAPSGSNPDTDGDGFANSCDTDSDNDGITDIVEGRFTCTNSVTTSMNTVPYPLNTLFNAAQNTTPVTIDNLSYGTLNFTASLVGTATWGAASGTSGNVNRVGGVQIKNNFSAVGDYIYLQPINTRTTNTGAVANPSNYALYTLLLPYKTDNFQFISAGLNSDDAYEIYAFNGATPIPLNPSNLSNFSPALGTAGTWTVSDLGNGLKVTNALAAGGADVDQNLFTTTITGEVTRIEIRSYKNLTGTNSNTVTTGITSLIYCSDYSIVDSDADGISNYLDLDSDNDGCSDANEYYNSAIADGGDGGVYGTGTPVVGSEGQVTTASYTGNYNNVTVATQLNITSQPSNSIVNAGANTSFTVGATGINTTTFSAGTANYTIPPATNANAGLVYQWQISTNSGSTWTNLSNGGQYSGATTSSLSVNNTTAAQNGNQFRAVVSHSGKICPIISNAAQVTILQANVGITKTVNNLTPNIGSNVIFTLTADNAGPNNAAGVEVTDVLPNGYTFVSATPSVGTFNSGTGLWTVGTLNNGANATLTVTATVNATGSYANTATISSTTSDPTPGNNTDTETPTPGAQSNLSVVKTVDNATPNVGDNVTFTITASNAGPSAATGVSVNDVLPSGYTFVSATPSTGTWTAPNWSVGGLANGASATLSIVATVNATGSYSNTATITSTTSDPTPGNNTDTETPTPVAQSNLSVVKTVDNGTPNVGDNVTFTITASNAGPSAATGVSVNDVLPSGYTFVSATPSTGTWTAPNWSVGGLANGASATLSIVATVNATGSYSNTATITSTTSDPTPGNNTDTENPTPVAQSNLSVVKTVDNATPNVGDNVTFTITASNAGPSAATGVSVNDVLPSGYTFVSATPSTGTWTAPNWSVGGLANGASATLSIVATVNATGSYSNTATITSTTSDPTPGNNTDTETPTPVAQSNLSVVKTVDNATPNVGDNVTFTITASNAGPSAATGVSVNDVLPSGYTFVSATPSTGTWTAPNWSVGGLANGASATLSIVATVNATGSYSNTATITGLENDPTPGNNTDTETPTPVAQSNLSVVKTVDNATPNVGDNVTFTITASNAGPSAATGVSVNDVLPSGYTFVSATPSTGTWTAPNWSVGGLANGASATLSIVATVNATGSYSNTATITGLENDPTPGNNTDTEIPNVNHAPVAVNDIYTVVEDNTVTLNPLALDTDLDGDTLTVTSINGTALTGGVQTIPVSNGTINISALGVITFTPDANYNSAMAISIPYVISDGTVTAAANELITVTAANDAPVAVNDIYTVVEDNTVTLNPLALDTDLDGDNLTVTSINGTALTGGVQTIPVSNGTVNISALGVITFTPDTNYNSATAISIPYVISDGTVTAAANELITVTAANDAPVAVNDIYTVVEDNTVTLNPLALDTDVDGDTLTVTSINGTALTGGVQTIPVSNGTVNISALGVISFTPAADFNSATPISIPYVISDGTVTATANELITVTAANDAPVAVNDIYTVVEDNTVTLNPLALDTDLDGDTLTVTSINGTALTGGVQTIPVSNGTVNISALGVITFTPDTNYNSATAISIPYVISDGTVTAAANELITVTAANDAPVAVNDIYTVVEDNTVTLNPLALDTDVDGDTLTVTSINGTALTGGVQTIPVSNGTVNISALGVISFTPAADFNSATPISIPYVISDGTVTATANELITVTAANDAPVAVNDIYTVVEDNTVTLNPLALDTDVDGDTLTVTSINGTALTGGVQTIPVSNGTVNISALGVISFTPAADFNSATPISIPYVISDGTVTATANELITVTAANDAPVAVNDIYTVVEDNTVTLNPLALDTDLDGDTLTVTSINGTALTGGVQTIPVSNGTVNISALGVITFTPDTNYNSATAISIPYVISDGTVTAAANELITVTAANDAPVAVNDIYTVVEDNTVTLNPLALDTDVDGDTLTVTSINGTALTGGVQTIPVSNGTVNISALGVISFTPAADFNSATPISIPYVISDGTVTATANELITVTAANDAPVAVNDIYTVVEDNTVTLNPLALDTDLDGDTLTVTSINGTALTGGVQTITVSNGTVNISALGVITFTPDANYNSATAISIPYVISDGTVTATANELITVTAANDAPIANYDTNTGISSIAEATLINALSATDVDGTIASYRVISLPTNGLLALAGIPITVNQILTPAEAAMLTYDPSGTYTGLDTFMFTATDNLGAVSGSATITIPIENNAPVAKDDTNVAIPLGAGATAINALTATDSDGMVVNYIVVTLPSNGILALSGTPILVNQVLTPAEAAMLTYDPNGVFSGNDTFTFTVTDNNGAIDSTPAVITISVDKRQIHAVNDEIGSVVGINESVDVINVLDNDTLDNNPIVLSDIKLEVLIPDPKGLLTLKSDGTAQIAPNTPAGTYTLTYQICEAANGSNCTTATATVTVIAPEMSVTAESYCSDNTAYVTYKVTADNFTPKGLVTINWIDSANNIVATQSNMPLNGTVLWPGTVVDSNNKPIDWPGWILLNGKWIEGNDGFELTRPAVTMQFTLNPNKSVLVNYPSAEVGCNARPQFGIVAENDDIVADGIKGSLEVINVLDNDKLNGVPVNPADVILKGQNFPAGITLNDDGTINVAAGTKGGDHTLTYQICEKADANNCTTATVHIFVETPAVSLIMKASLNDNNGNGFPEAGETITYTFTVKNTGNTALENVLIKDLLPGVIITGGPINLGVDESDTFTFTGTYTLTQADINAGVVSNQATVSGVTQSGITASDNSDSENEGSDKPTVINLNGCDLEVHNAVSLNGDEKNERFYIRGMECYPDNTVQIFNRWGVLVFERDHYNNNDVAFKGFSEGRTTVKQSEGLPEGTYYYIIRYKDNQSKPQQQAGYLYLTR